MCDKGFFCPLKHFLVDIVRLLSYFSSMQILLCINKRYSTCDLFIFLNGFWTKNVSGLFLLRNLGIFTKIIF